MNEETAESLAAAALEKIARAFAGRRPPSLITDSLQLTDGEYAEVMAFEGLRWEDVDFELVRDCPDAVFWFSPEAYCYYLPGILAAGLRAGRWDSNAYDSIIGCLDRTPEPDYWDDFFLPRWPRLSAPELEAVAARAGWLELVQPDGYHANTYQRVQETLRLLKWQVQRGSSH